MRRTSFSTFGLVIEIVGLCAGGLIYQSGLVGPQGIVPMLWGVAIAGIGLLTGGIFGVVSLVKEEKRPLLAMIAIILPLGTLALLIVRRMFPL